MKSMFDNYFGGKIDSRSVMQNKIRTMQTCGSVISETEHCVQDWKDSKFHQESSVSGGAPFLGDAFVIPNS